MSLSCTTVTWRGLTFSGAEGADFSIASLQGWEGLPGARRETFGRPQSHGRFDAPSWADERIVTLGGACYSSDARDALLAQLGSVLTWESTTGRPEELLVHNAGRALTGFARLTAFEVQQTPNWSMGHFPYVVEWRCSDPLRYGDLISASTTFPVRTGGLRFPLYSDGDGNDVGALDFGEVSQTGRVLLTNDGTADSWPQFTIDGPVSSAGFEIVKVGTGARLVFEDSVPTGSSLVLDAATGAAVIDGTADRGGRLTWRDWAPVPAGGSAEFAFIPLGATSSAVLTATVRPAFW